jgi:hypothetical protein
MSLFNKDAEKKQEERQKSLQYRYSLQEFMNDNGEIFVGLSEALSSPESLLQDSDSNKKTEIFKNLLEKNKELSVKIAAKILNKDESEVTKLDVKPFRRTSAQFIISSWKNNKDIDLEEISTIISDSASVMVPEDEVNIYKYMENSHVNSIRLTAANVNLKLIEPVMVYSFRNPNPETIISELSDSVMNVAKKSVDSVLGSESNQDDRISLLQTISNHLSSIMVSCYERRSFHFLNKIKNKSDEEIEQLLKKDEPLQNILNDFNKWSVMFSSSAFVYAKAIQENKKDNTPKAYPTA